MTTRPVAASLLACAARRDHGYLCDGPTAAPADDEPNARYRLFEGLEGRALGGLFFERIEAP